jgi:hypothetical protein
LAGCDRARERAEQRELLIEWARQHGRLADTRSEGDQSYRGLLQAFLQTRSDLAGNEHVVVLSAEEGRVYKITYPDRFGKAYPRITGQPTFQDATPLEYLVRLLLCNEVFGDDLSLEQVVIDQQHTVRVVTSQPLIIGTQPAEVNVHRYLYGIGFEPVEAVDRVPMTNDWYREQDSIMIFDAHGGNFIETREGHVLPIDIYVERIMP